MLQNKKKPILRYNSILKKPGYLWTAGTYLDILDI